jgi:hypothetical protein
LLGSRSQPSFGTAIAYIPCLKARGFTLGIVIVATYQADIQTMQVYAKRWSIECFFKAIKTAGFNIEDTHLTDQKRLEKLFAVVAIAFVWVYLIGEYQNQRKTIPILIHQRRAFSIFRYGLDEINKALLFDSQLVTVYINLLTRT